MCKNGILLFIIIDKVGGNMKQKCPICKYTWESRVTKPKECPECKGRLGRKK
jgi:rubrerythrin